MRAGPAVVIHIHSARSASTSAVRWRRTVLVSRDRTTRTGRPNEGHEARSAMSKHRTAVPARRKPVRLRHPAERHRVHVEVAALLLEDRERVLPHGEHRLEEAGLRVQRVPEHDVERTPVRGMHPRGGGACRPRGRPPRSGGSAGCLERWRSSPPAPPGCGASSGRPRPCQAARRRPPAFPAGTPARAGGPAARRLAGLHPLPVDLTDLLEQLAQLPVLPQPALDGPPLTDRDQR